MATGIQDAYFEGLSEGGIGPEDVDESDVRAVDEMTKAQHEFLTDYVLDVQDARGDDAAEEAVLGRVDYWSQSMQVAYQKGLTSAKANEMVTWHLGATEEHCDTCSWLNNQRHRRKWFDDKGYIPRQPGSKTLDCGGWRCDCTLEA